MWHFWFQILKTRNDRGGYEHNMKRYISNNIFFIIINIIVFCEII